MVFHIRAYREGDTAGLLRVHRSAILAISTEIYSQAELESWNHGKTEDLYIRAIEEGEAYLIGETGGVMAGFCSYKCHPDQTGEICGLYVDPKAQGQGLGSALLRRAEQALVSENAARLMIEASLAALPFYLRAGYQVTEELTHQTRGGLPLAISRVERSIAL
ncbi:MAG: GNAT family N-acetyltransferase [Pseudomonadota bacterium]